MVPESTRTIFYFSDVSLAAYHQNNARQKKFLGPIRKTFPLSVAREPDWSVKKIGCDSLFSPSWTAISFKFEEYWQSVGALVDYLYARFVLQNNVVNGMRAHQKPIENFSVIEAWNFDKSFRIHCVDPERKLGHVTLWLSKREKKIDKTLSIPRLTFVRLFIPLWLIPMAGSVAFLFFSIMKNCYQGCRL